MPLVFAQSFDIESTGSDMPGGKDALFAIGAAVLSIDTDSGAIERVDSRRWVLSLAPPDSSADTWAALWRSHGYDMRCFEEFWSKHLGVLNAMMAMTADLFSSSKAMADSFAAYIAESEAKFQPQIRVYDTIGFDVTNLEALLVEHGHRSLFLTTQGRPCSPSYLGDIMRSALGISPLHRALGLNDAQKEAIARHNAAAVPAGLAHTHDPADDALCIAYKWAHYALKLHFKPVTAV